ncbi:TcfC E-set like domain-containing protein [Vibrio profundum]|uniref:TcfC E-set like domain-containing protein n=1 Tax=Vibrio profundum TaxID=2910247 RepID=UPI003D13DF0E
MEVLKNRKRYAFYFIFIIIFSSFSIAYKAYANTEIPEGFENISDDETTIVDVYFGKEDLGSYLAHFNDEEITFEEHEELFNKLKGVIKKDYLAIISRKLSEPLNANTNLACTHGERCGYIVPKTLSVILYRNRYRVSVFINPEFLQKKSNAAGYLADSSAGFSAINQLSGNVIGGNPASTDYTLSHKMRLGYGNWGAKLDDSFSGTNSDTQNAHYYSIQNINASYRKQQYMAQLGIQDTLGTLIIPQYKVLGASVSTKTDLMNNYQSQIATPLEVSLVSPSYIEIYKDNRLVTTQYFTQGNHYLDTSLLPTGTYSIQLKTIAINGQTSSRTTYFVKTDALPLYSLPSFYISYGQLADISSTETFPRVNGVDSINISAEQRLHHFFGLAEHTVLLGNKEFIGELEFISQLPQVSIIASSAASNLGDYGAGLAVSGYVHHVNISTIYRRIWANESADSQRVNQYVSDSLSSTSRISTDFSYQLSDTMLDFGLGYGLDNQQSTHFYSFGVDHKFHLSDHTSLNINLDTSTNQDENSLFLTFTFNFDDVGGFDYAVSSYAERIDDKNEDHTDDTLGMSVEAGKHFKVGDSSNYYLSDLSASSKSRYLTQFISTETPTANLNAQTTVNRSDSTTSTLYNIKAFTSHVYTGAHHGAFSGNENDSGVMLHVYAPKEGKYDVLVNGRVTMTIENNKSYFLSLPSFKTYDIAISSRSHDLRVLDSKREVTLHDGSVQDLDWRAQSTYLLIGQFVSPSGVPISHADIEGGAEFAQTDEEGFSQVDVLSGHSLTLATSNHHHCEVNTDNIHPEDDVAYVDHLVCHPL